MPGHLSRPIVVSPFQNEPWETSARSGRDRSPLPTVPGDVARSKHVSACRGIGITGWKNTGERVGMGPALREDCCSWTFAGDHCCSLLWGTRIPTGPGLPASLLQPISRPISGRISGIWNKLPRIPNRSYWRGGNRELLSLLSLVVQASLLPALEPAPKRFRRLQGTSARNDSFHAHIFIQ